MVDLAVGVLIGAAFGKIVASLTTNMISPFIGLATGGLDLGSKYIVLRAGATPGKNYASAADATKDGATILGYGIFINDIITFLVTALVVFMIVKAYNHIRRKETPPDALPAPADIVLLTEIRDLLSTKKVPSSES